jgi:hypothetical protein
MRVASTRPRGPARRASIYTIWRHPGNNSAALPGDGTRPDSRAPRHIVKLDVDLVERIPMATDPSTRAGEPALDAASLYREEIYTDRKAGTLRVLVPVTRHGAPDPSRTTIYSGEAQLMTNMGPLPISFDIDATNLAEAVAKYAGAAKDGVERAMRDLMELRRQASSSIVIPQSGALPPVGPLGGGGKIQIP